MPFVSRTQLIHIASALGLLVVISVQGYLLCQYLNLLNVFYVNAYLWLVGDTVVILMFLAALLVSAKHLGRATSYGSFADDIDFSEQNASRYFGELPLGYVSWLLYSTLLLARVAIIYNKGIPELSKEGFFGARTLEVSVGLCAVVFALLVEGHNYSRRESPRFHLVSLLFDETCIELLDTVSLLGEMHENMEKIKPKNAPALVKCILGFCCVNFLLPTIYIYRLGVFNFEDTRFTSRVTFVYNLSHLLLLDIPYLVLRLYMWIVFGGEMSVFFLRSILTGSIMLRSAFDSYQDMFSSVSRGTIRPTLLKRMLHKNVEHEGNS